MANQFVINKRFRVNEAINTIIDMETGIESRLEPWLMKLILLLATHNGEVVTRQEIITQIWNDYGNADEGLSQAISFLRKIFVDTDKQLIRTIPKKGYILEASVSEYKPIPLGPASKAPSSLRKLRSAIPMAIAIVALLLFWRLRFWDNPNSINEPPGTVIDTTYQHQEMRNAIQLKN